MRLNTIIDILKSFPKLGKKTALIHHIGYRTFKYNYDQLFKKICSCALFYEELGIKKNDRVILWGKEGFEWVIAYWACVATGAVVIPVDHRYDLSFIKKVVRITAPKAIIGNAEKITSNLSKDLLKVPYEHIKNLPKKEDLLLKDPSENDMFQIVFTSGTTSDPKGIVQRHKNVCSVLNPIAKEVKRYKKIFTVLGQLKVLLLVPLTHMLGQTLGLFLIPIIDGILVLGERIDPPYVIRLVKNKKVNTIVCVPWFLRQLKIFMQKKLNLRDELGFKDILKIHKELGFRMFSFVSGGAFLEPELEVWWKKLKFLVIQGYGLTEASPIVAINHPFDSKTGSLGKKLANQMVKLAPDGEILVKGENVCKEYYTSSGLKKLSQEWLHTGDLAHMDREGRLYFKGRKKDVIVLSSGENVYPEDVEKLLKSFSEVKDCVVVGLKENGTEKVHAVLLLEKNINKSPEEIILTANKLLKPHQRIKSWSIWPYNDFPRTSTYKIRKKDVINALLKDKKVYPSTYTPDILDIIAKLKNIPKNRLSFDLRLKEDLMFSSVEYVELICALEENFKTILNDDVFEAKTIKELDETLKRYKDYNSLEEINVFNWRLFWPVRIVRFVFVNFLFIPIFKSILKIVLSDQNMMMQIKKKSVIICANHTSHLDILVIMMSLPLDVRTRIVPLVSPYPFWHYLKKSKNFIKRWWHFFKYLLLGILFNGIPINFDPKDIKKSLLLLGDCIDKGFYPLIFPEGERSKDGKIKPFRPGVFLLAEKLKAEVFPLVIKGVNKVLPVGKFIPKPGKVYVTPCPPVQLDTKDSMSGFLQKLEEIFIKNLGA